MSEENSTAVAMVTEVITQALPKISLAYRYAGEPLRVEMHMKGAHTQTGTVRFRLAKPESYVRVTFEVSGSTGDGETWHFCRVGITTADGDEREFVGQRVNDDLYVMSGATWLYCLDIKELMLVALRRLGNTADEVANSLRQRGYSAKPEGLDRFIEVLLGFNIVQLLPPTDGCPLWGMHARNRNVNDEFIVLNRQLPLAVSRFLNKSEVAATR